MKIFIYRKLSFSVSWGISGYECSGYSLVAQDGSLSVYTFNFMFKNEEIS